VFNTIIESIEQSPKRTRFFVQGAGGTGKTFLYKCFYSYFRSRGKIVLCVASSGIAAQLLPSGRTSYSRFQIPLNIDEFSTCAITRDSAVAELLRRTGLIIWDKVPMQHKYCFEAVSWYIKRYLCN
jgi:hypothetical protein